jgi:UDP-N-acetyl-D-mannosaminuronic acid transferase (WecB/TagA/CpsF family)
MIKLFDVNMPQITKWELKEKIVNLDSTKKHSLYWLYSEFILRANRNSWYKKVLNESTFQAVDGKGLHWSMYKAISNDIFPSLYTNKIIDFPLILRLPLFLILFCLQLLINFFSGIWNIAIVQKNFTTKTLNETILGRDFTYEILRICNIKKYKTMIIGGSNEDDQVSKEMIQKIYPDINLTLWTRKTNTLLMMDQMSNQQRSKNSKFNLRDLWQTFGKPQQYLTTSNLYEQFPDLIEAKNAIIKNKPDVILVCIGGASGKQEFFIHDIMNDDKTKFILATGLGAAIDHLGGGAKQSLPPKLTQQMGIEWLWRFIDQPYRRFRIIDSIFTLFWWTTLYQFIKDIQYKNYVAMNKVTHQDQVLLVQDYSLLPNNIGYSLPIVKIKKNQSIEEAGLNFLNSEFKLNLAPNNIIKIPEKGREVQNPISIFSFLINSCRYKSNQYYINFFDAKVKQNLFTPQNFLSAEFIPFREYNKLVNPDRIQFNNQNPIA